jgi:uncharacterized protein DUF2505
MRTVTESFVLPCDCDTFWNTFLDERYVRALFMEELKFKELDILLLTDSARKIRAVPSMKLPAVLEKLVGDSFAYEEHGTLDRAKSEWTWRMQQPESTDPKKKGKKEIVSTRGVIRVAPAGDGKCRRTDEMQIEAKMFGVGGIIESTVEKEVRSVWTKELAFLTQWLAKPRA